MNLDLKFESAGHSMNFTKNKALIPGSKVNDRDVGNSSCFMPVFRHDDADGAWTFGTHFMKDYYWVFDATDATDGWRLGFGKRSKGIIVDPAADNIVPPTPDDSDDGNPGPYFWIILSGVFLMLLGALVLLARRFCSRKTQYNSE